MDRAKELLQIMKRRKAGLVGTYIQKFHVPISKADYAGKDPREKRQREKESLIAHEHKRLEKSRCSAP